MSEKKFALQTVGDTVVRNNQTNEIYWNHNLVHLINSLSKENEQLKQELRGMNELLESYRETIKHDAELLADATRNGYLPPLEDFVKR